MASTKEFMDYVTDQLSDINITTKRMFGEYGVYYNGKIFGLVCDDQLFVKVTEVGKSLSPEPVYAPPYKGAKDYLLIDNLEDRNFLRELIVKTCDELPMPKPKKKKQLK